jgi:hypothetical protein
MSTQSKLDWTGHAVEKKEKQNGHEGVRTGWQVEEEKTKDVGVNGRQVPR